MTDAPAPPLWSPLALLAPLEARLVGTLPRAGVTGISIDTRTLKPGDLFFAIKGDAHDGHDFVGAAFEKGATGAVVAEARIEALPRAATYFVVHDVLAALERLGRAARARAQGTMIAVTGSVGKTSAKEALRLVLGAQGPTHASPASYNNHWGVPLTLARLPRAARFGVFEIGMNHAGEITPLTAMVRPHVAVVTTIGPVHLENLGSLDAIADAKAEIFSGLQEGGTAVIHRDIDQYERLRAAAAPHRVVSFGASEEADAHLVDVRPGEDFSDVTASIDGVHVLYRVSAPGRHLVINSLGVLAAAKAAGADLQEAAESLTRWTPPAGRGKRETLSVDGAPFTLIDESYNANPLSMRAALALLAQARPGPNGRRVAVLGDMLELGPDAPALHADLDGPLAESGADVVFVAGKLMKNLADRLPPEKVGGWGLKVQNLRDHVLDAVRGGDVVMIKGSNGSRMSHIVKAMRERFGASEPEAQREGQGEAQDKGQGKGQGKEQETA